MTSLFALKPFDLQIRDGKCRGVRDGKPITGWCRDSMAVAAAVRRKELRHE